MRRHVRAGGATARGERRSCCWPALRHRPAQGNRPGRRDADAVHGLGAADMKGAVAVAVELALARGGDDRPRPFFGARSWRSPRARWPGCSSASRGCGRQISSS
jgi:hypothetical protein